MCDSTSTNPNPPNNIPDPCSSGRGWVRLIINPDGLTAKNPCTGTNVPVPPDPNTPPDAPNSVTIWGWITHPVNAPEEDLIDNGVDVSDNPLTIAPLNTPRVIAKTVNKNSTEDLSHGTNGNYTGMDHYYDGLLTETNSNLFGIMRNMFHGFTVLDNELQNVGDDMIDKFEANTGGNYSNPTLTQKVSDNHTTINFLKKFGHDLNDQLALHNYNIDDVPTLPTLDYRIKFDGTYNLWHGLEVLINDTEYTEIQIDKYEKTSDYWKAEFTITITDHFGLDKQDMVDFQEYDPGFPAWWILQHIRDHVPFTTVIVLHKTLIWHF